MKQKMILMVLVLGLYSISMSAQTKKKVPAKKSNTSVSSIIKTREVGEDGFIWYKIKKGNLYGVYDVEGREIIPIIYRYIDYVSSTYYLYPIRYFRVYSGDYVGLYTRKGGLILSTDKHYTMGGGGSTPEGVKNMVYWVVKKNDGGYVVLDARGNEVISADRNYSRIMLFPDLGTHGEPYYFKIFQGDCEGLCDLDGKELCPPQYKSCYIANGTIIKTKLSGETNSEKISYFGNTRYNYATYDDLYEYSVSNSSFTSGSTVTSSSSSPNNNAANSNSNSSTTTIIVEQHGPVQVWVPCGGCQLSPGRCSYCGGSGWGYNNRLCSRCNGTGKCTICNGTGGHNEVQYR